LAEYWVWLVLKVSDERLQFTGYRLKAPLLVQDFWQKASSFWLMVPSWLLSKGKRLLAKGDR